LIRIEGSKITVPAGGSVFFFSVPSLVPDVLLLILRQGKKFVMQNLNLLRKIMT
jgi:hypothetical protein